MTSDLINRYIDQRRIAGAKNATIKRELAAWREMFRLAYYSEPQKVVRVPKFKHLEENNVRRGFLEQSQYDALAAKASQLWLR